MSDDFTPSGATVTLDVPVLDPAVRAELVAAIVAQAAERSVPCDDELAGYVLTELVAARDHGYAYPGDYYHVFDVEEDRFDAAHAVLDVIAEDEAAPTPGSLHARVNAWALREGESFLHTKDPEYSGYCSVTIRIVPAGTTGTDNS